MATYAAQAAAFPAVNNSFYIHNMIMTYDNGVNLCLISDGYLKNNNTQVYKTKFVQMYAYNAAGIEIDNNSPKVNFISADPDAQFYVDAFTYNSSYTSADIANIIIRVVGTLLNNTGEKLLAYRSIVPVNGPISDPPVPCFTAGSRILTPDGYKPVELIQTGDYVLTADNRPVPVKAYCRTVKTTSENAPFLIPANTFAPGSPKNNLHLSPWHAFVVKRGYWLKPFNAAEFYEAVVQYDVGKEVNYYHLECPNYLKDNLICEGTVVESFSGNQINAMKGRIYTWNRQNKAYTRYSGPIEKNNN